MPILVIAQNSTKISSFSNIEEYVSKAMENWEVPGLAIAIVKDDSIVFCKGFGVLKINNPELVNQHTIFAIGSCTKAFTAAALGILVDEGKIDWDDKVIGYLPKFQLSDPYLTQELTIRDLLSHRSGLEPCNGLWYGTFFDSQELLYRMRYIKPMIGFRTAWNYNNLMFLVAGQIIPAVTKIDWSDFINRRIFLPLKMSESYTSNNQLNDISNIATPHVKVENTVKPIAWRHIDHIAPAGSICSNVLDMAQWLRLLLNLGMVDGEQIISSNTINEMHSPQSIRKNSKSFNENFHLYGLGWTLQDYRGIKMISHNGALDGTSSRIALLPSHKLGIVILTNLHGTSITSVLICHIIDAYLEESLIDDWNAKLLAIAMEEKTLAKAKELELSKNRLKDTTPSLDLNLYEGIYSNEVYGDILITQAQAGLHYDFHSFGGELSHWQLDTFLFIPTENAPYSTNTFLKFIINEKGEIEYVLVDGNMEGVFYKK
jgi:CubicO group peptidase (beta-lactamase class C family)